jgi:Holliday junction resolvasome RuvABC DNA-binding subunit
MESERFKMASETNRPQIQIINAETGEQITRDMNDEELAISVESSAQIQIQNSEINAQLSARQSALSKLAALGLTQEEIEAL